MTGFKNFVMRGNLVELAVAVVIGTQFSSLLKLLDRNEAATSRDCPECTMSIPVAARRCPECTAEIAPATEQPRQLV
jgi:large conductance mechanosensitive channel